MKSKLRAVAGVLAYSPGRIVYRVLPGFTKNLLSQWPNRGPKGRLKHLLYESVRREHMRRYYAAGKSTAERESLKSICMSGEQGAQWANYYAEIGFDETSMDINPSYRMVDERLSSGEISSFHQVGCSSGREVAYFARRYPSIQFTGSDMSDAIVKLCADRYADVPNLKFTLVRLERLNEPDLDRLTADMLFASGDLQYLDPDSFERFVDLTKGACKELISNQPVAASFLGSGEISSQPRNNFKWNHPYGSLFSRGGWNLLSEKTLADDVSDAVAVSVHVTSETGEAI
jgi:hypothetical protein